MNKTTQIIVFSLMALFCLSFLVYGFIKADEADKARIEAEARRLEAERLKDEAVNLVKEARLAEAEAQRQIKLAEQALTDCQSK